MALVVIATYGLVWPGGAGFGPARRGEETNGLWWRIPRIVARHGLAWSGLVRHCRVRRGAVRHGLGTNGAFHFKMSNA